MCSWSATGRCVFLTQRFLSERLWLGGFASLFHMVRGVENVTGIVQSHRAGAGSSGTALRSRTVSRCSKGSGKFKRTNGAVEARTGTMARSAAVVLTSPVGSAKEARSGCCDARVGNAGNSSVFGEGHCTREPASN